MTAADLVAALRAAGVELVPERNRLRVHPASKVPPDLLESLRQRETEVLQLLSRDPQSRAVARRHPWPDSLPGLGVRRIGPYEPCSERSECGDGSWVRYGDLVFCAWHAWARWLKCNEDP